MSSAHSGAPERIDPLLRTWSSLGSDAERSEFLAANPDLRDRAHVDTLCEESGRAAKSDLAGAVLLAEGAERLANLLSDTRGRGRALRALANATHLKGHYHDAAEYYAQALEHFPGRDDRRDEAATRSSALHNLIYLGDYERARAWADRARQIFEELGDTLRLARLDLNYANLLFRNDRWEEALELYESAGNAFREVGGAEDLAACLTNQATCLISLNRFFQALQVYKQARELCVEGDWPVLLAEVDYNIAHLYFLRGDYTRALEQYQAARRRAGALGDQLHLGLCDLDQSEIYIELNLVDEAVRLASRAYERFVLLGVSYEAAKALTNLAVGNSRQGKAFLALDLLVKAREMFVKEGNQNWPPVLDLYRALLLFAEGRLFESERLARTARESFEAASIPSKSAACEILLAMVARDSGDPKAAIDAVGSAFGLLRSLNLPALSYQAYLVLGQAEEARGNRKDARRAYEAAEVWLERTRGHRQPEDLKIGFSGERLFVYESLVSVAADNASDSWAGGVGERVFALAERAKARNLANLIAFRASVLPAKTISRSALVGDIRSLREELNWYYRQIDLGQMAAEEQGRKRVGSLRETSRQQERKLVRTLREVRSRDREFSALQDAECVEIASVQEILPEDAALLEYYVARGVVYGAVLTRDALHVRPVSLLSRTQDVHRGLQFQLSKTLTEGRGRAAGRDEHDAGTLSALKSLYEELLAPFSGHLERPNLIVVPHGHLHYVPFHALFDGAKYVGDEHTVSYALSASSYYRCRVKTPAAENRALLVDAVGTGETALAAVLAPFDGAQVECEVHTGERATKEALTGSDGRHRIVHLAVRSRVRQDNPMFSSVEFADSAMSLFDFYGLELSADLVVVTGCGGSLDSLSQADELMALAEGLLYAGARAVALDLWRPRNGASPEFWGLFYERFCAGECASGALEAAAAAFRTTHPHPADWAPAVLIGDPGAGRAYADA